ncbi:Ribosome-releasing factor 2-like 1, partial [Homarus americanus]
RPARWPAPAETVDHGASPPSTSGDNITQHWHHGTLMQVKQQPEAYVILQLCDKDDSVRSMMETLLWTTWSRREREASPSHQRPRSLGQPQNQPGGHPGHVDFTMEVGSSLQSLGRAVAIFDASAGVGSVPHCVASGRSLPGAATLLPQQDGQTSG